MRTPFAAALPLMAARAAGLGATFLVPVVLARVFSQSEFGAYKQVFLIYGTLFIVAQVGLSESLYYFLPQRPRDGGRYTMNAVLGLTLAGGVCLGILWFLAGGPQGPRTAPALGPLLPATGLYLMLMLISSVLEVVLVSRQRHALASATYVVSDLLRAASFVAPALLAPRLDALLYGAILFAAVRLLFTLVRLHREFPGSLRPDAALLGGQLRYALPFAVAVLVEVLQANLHQYAVLSRVDAATFAIYAVGCLQVPLIDLIGSSVCNVMMVSMTRARVEDRAADVPALWDHTTRCLALVFLPLVGLLLVCAHDLIVVLFTQRYAASVPIFRLWSLSILASVFQVDGVLRAHAQTRFIFLLNVARLALVVCLLGFLMGAFGLAGAVAASLAATFAGKAIGLARIRRILSVPVARLLPWGSLGLTLLASAAAAAPALIVRSLVAGAPALALLLASLVYGVAFIALAVALRLVDPSRLFERRGALGFRFARAVPDAGSGIS